MIYGEDTDLWARAEKIFKTEKLKEPETYIYTRAETSVSKNFTNDSTQNLSSSM
jgi:hypothetical protein